jgi:2-octaprenyl-6-methoxyphenol hydroxylase
LFSNDVAPLRFVRSTGLGLVNKSSTLRKFFMRVAGNDMGDLPSLMRA